jgi:hypothetical protein
MITREQAVKLAESGWWKDLPDDVVVAFQLFESRLCMDFDDFHAAVQRSLGRPVFTHEFGTDGAKRLEEEFLGKRPRATFEEIVDLIPADKRILWVIPE